MQAFNERQARIAAVMHSEDATPAYIAAAIGELGPAACTHWVLAQNGDPRPYARKLKEAGLIDLDCVKPHAAWLDHVIVDGVAVRFNKIAMDFILGKNEI